MKSKGYVLILMLAVFPIKGVCQILKQSTDLESKRRAVLTYTSVNEIPSGALQGREERGGGDSGGGTGVWLNGHLQLKDFIGCPIDKSISSNDKINSLSFSQISSQINKIDSQSVKKALKQTSLISDALLEKLVWAASARANWYLVDASLKLNTDNDHKLAVFKRPLGILIDSKLYTQLSSIEKHGLLLHETLRMISIGFGLQLNTAEIEDITCKSFSGQKLDLNKYPQLKKYFDTLVNANSTELSNSHRQLWLTTLESISDLKDVAYVPAGTMKYFFYQLDSSKFEIFRAVTASATAEQLNSIFFGWAGREVKQICSSKLDCNYFEEWPMAPFESAVTAKWNLVRLSPIALEWSHEKSATSLLVSKMEIRSDQQSTFCNSFSNGKIVYRPATLAQVSQITASHHELSMILNRDDLNTMLENDIPFSSEMKMGQQSLWTPRNDLSSGLAVLNADWSGLGRAVCIQGTSH